MGAVRLIIQCDDDDWVADGLPRVHISPNRVTVLKRASAACIRENRCACAHLRVPHQQSFGENVFLSMREADVVRRKCPSVG